MTAAKTDTIDGLNIAIYPDPTALGAAAADLVADKVRAAIAQRGKARVIFATGASQYEFLDALLKLDDVDWSVVEAFHLDEYVGISDTHPASFRRYLRERLFSKVDFAAVHLLQGDARDPQAECDRYSALLRQGPIDLACIGIGENGHLAFNDPPADFETDAPVHVVTLDEACRTQQVGEGHFPTLADVPPTALSLSIPAILQAATLSVAVPDARKAAAVHDAVRGPVTPDCPASALRGHRDCHLFLDSASAAQI